MKRRSHCIGSVSDRSPVRSPRSQTIRAKPCWPTSNGAGRVAAANLPNSGQAARAFFEFRAERQAKEKLAQRAKKETEAKGMAVGTADSNAMNPNGDAQAPKPEPAQTQQNPQPPPLPAQLV